MTASAEIRIDLGAVVHDEKGEKWVYVGSGQRWPYSGGVYHRFVKAQKDRLQEPGWTYEAVSLETLRKKFSDLP